ncbi:tetratricopeptide repeat protein [Brumimicrobium glaciale]|uniref:Tetratricopeptide repeat protein n=1 Tax=Brumimicrobium glaciale TaxID=200475 RepID=A0A4Q4KQ51_9FLAO|nr:tetratricopeptide repeat protein [Brumimicrobium glaciale]RYM35517.1 tetratricopeptide repeat protein [Brumimicrobium glaciale]
MKRSSLHIIFLLGFLFVLSESTAQENYDFIEQKWIEVKNNIENDQLNEVKASFDEFAKLSIRNKQDTILSAAIIQIGNYYKDQGEYGERIKWYQFALDSLCQKEGVSCFDIRREFADIYAFIEQYEKAINLHKANLDVLITEKNQEAVSLEYSTIATNYFRNGDLENSEKYYLKSLTSAQQNENTFYTLLSYNNLGFFYSQIPNYSEAEKYYLKGIEMIEGPENPSQYYKAQLALLKGNLGGNYIKNKEKVELGIRFLNEDINYNLENNGHDLAINAAVELTKYYYENKQFKQAEETLQNCLDRLEEPKKSKTFTGNLVPVYYWLFKVHLEQQENQKALFYFKEYDSLKTNRDEAREERRFIIEKSLLENILNVQLDYQNQQIQLKNKENEVLQEKNNHFFYRLIIGIVSFITLAILILLYSRKRISLMRINKELAENKFEVEKLEKEKTKLELTYKNKDLTDFAIDISRKQDVLIDVKSKLNEILNNKSDLDDTKKEIKTLINYTNNNMLVDEQLKEFQENIEEVNYKFLDQLQKRYPELTELDKNVCGLIRLGLSNKEIATMRNVSYKAIRMSRYRIRKKLGLEKEVNLVEFLKSIE